MEKNEAAVQKIDDGETELNYRGWKAMPFVIGKPEEALFRVFCILFMKFTIYAALWFQGMRLLRSWEPLEPWRTS